MLQSSTSPASFGYMRSSKRTLLLAHIWRALSQFPLCCLQPTLWHRACLMFRFGSMVSSWDAILGRGRGYFSQGIALSERQPFLEHCRLLQGIAGSRQVSLNHDTWRCRFWLTGLLDYWICCCREQLRCKQRPIVNAALAFDNEKSVSRSSHLHLAECGAVSKALILSCYVLCACKPKLGCHAESMLQTK